MFKLQGDSNVGHYWWKYKISHLGQEPYLQLDFFHRMRNENEFIHIYLFFIKSEHRHHTISLNFRKLLYL